MLMTDNKKKGLIALVIKKISDGQHEGEKMEPKKVNEEGAEEDSSIGLDAAVEEIFAAIEQKDKSSFKQALKNFIELCYEESEEENKEWEE